MNRAWIFVIFFSLSLASSVLSQCTSVAGFIPCHNSSFEILPPLNATPYLLLPSILTTLDFTSEPLCTISPLTSPLDDVIIFSGEDEETDQAIRSTELLGTTTGGVTSFTLLPEAILLEAHLYGSALYHPNSRRVVVAGGTGSRGEGEKTLLHSTELFNPDTKTWSAGRDLNEGRQAFNMEILLNGNILIAGGYDLSFTNPLTSCEIYNGTHWTLTSPLNFARGSASMVVLSTGQALICGGYGDSFDSALDTCEIYDPSSQRWTLVNSTLNHARGDHAAVVLPGDKVLLVGGFDNEASLTAELYNPFSNNHLKATLLPPWDPRGVLSIDAAIALWLPKTENVLVGDLANGNLFTLYHPRSNTWTNFDKQSHPVLAALGEDFTLTLLANGQVLVAGGGKMMEASCTPSGDPHTGDQRLGTINTNYLFDEYENTFTVLSSALNEQRGQHLAVRVTA